MNITRIPVVLVGLAIVVACGACSSSSNPSAPSSAASTAATSATSPSPGNATGTTAGTGMDMDPVAAAMPEVRGVIKDIDAARMVFALQTRGGAKRVRASARTEIIIQASRRKVPFSALAKGMNVAVRGVTETGILNARWIAILPGR